MRVSLFGKKKKEKLYHLHENVSLNANITFRGETPSTWHTVEP